MGLRERKAWVDFVYKLPVPVHVRKEMLEIIHTADRLIHQTIGAIELTYLRESQRELIPPSIKKKKK